jgi:peptidoglycan/LPS O-acetylase OafA/YrhL
MLSFLVSKSFDFKNNSFDFIRLLLSILIVINHSETIGKLFHYSSLTVRDYNPTGTSLGGFSVYGFFVISGFLITRSFVNSSSIGNFCVNRIKRIYPGFIVSLFFTAFLFVPLYFLLQNNFNFAKFYSTYNLESVQYFIQNIFIEVRKPVIDNLNPDHFDINGPYWSLIHEVRAYFLVFILGILGVFNKRFFVAGLAILFNIGYVLNSLEINIPFTNLLFKNVFNSYIEDTHILIIFTYFIFGMVFYIFQENVIWNKWIYGLSILGLIIGWKFDIFPIFAPTCFTYFVLYSSQVFPLRNLAKKIGDLSYGIYIYSWPIQLCLLYLGLNKITGNKYIDYIYFASASIGLSVAAGYLSWNFVEKRWLVRKSQN